MKQIRSLIMLVLLAFATVVSANESAVIDSNNAFYSGETRDYILTAPPGFVLNQKEAQKDGYSCAFVPFGVSYQSAEVVIGVHYFRIRGMEYSEAFARDTSNLRRFFGKDFQLKNSDSGKRKFTVPVAVFEPLQNNKPIEMTRLAYVNGETEILIVDMTVRNKKKAVSALDAFDSLLSLFKTTVRKQLGDK